ncbi:hypothetical protein LSTR_LSTR009194 [Laodelphax striatellus]|uniref:Pyridine nucleotide-disulfide oxidoreductase domain-containing protein 2 n=1 Tax=Laodelphax striatellus TaxID=195883 RepID=A0A482XEL2_LAOST|nr:hypothetical protein LSTR_LSTR009194 [Laodelphax striatellus]
MYRFQKAIFSHTSITISHKCVTLRYINSKNLKSKYDAVIIGGGHNGLVAAAYLARSGRQVCVLERRHIVGGAAITEEIIPGFQFSRASYVLSLLKPEIIDDLDLKEHGLKLHFRNPGSYTPLRQHYWESTKRGRSLTLGSNYDENREQIAQFSEKDAQNYLHYERLLFNVVKSISPLMDVSSHTLMEEFINKNILQKIITICTHKELRNAVLALSSMRSETRDLYLFLTASISSILDEWFESEPIKATLATDALIGTMADCNTLCTGYGLLHHMMGNIDGRLGAWAYPEGGMGAVSQAIAKSAVSSGAEIYVNKCVKSIVLDGNNNVRCVESSDGLEIETKLVLSNATPSVTMNLLPENSFTSRYRRTIQHINYTSPVTKINVALSRLPSFDADPTTSSVEMPHHQATIHLNCENTSLLNEAYQDGFNGRLPKRPMIEMVIPSSLDKTIAPPGAHVCLLFTQFTPYKLAGRSWTNEVKEEYANIVFDSIEDYAPGFKSSVVGKEVLSPPDLEEIFGLTGGNIFHGSMSLDQILLNRPASYGWDTYSPETPVGGLLMCGSGAHPGGGVTGMPGKLAALHAIRNKNNS